MKTCSINIRTACILVVLCFFQSNYAQRIYNWDEYHILNNQTELPCLQGNVLTSSTTVNLKAPKSTDKVQVTNLCASCKGQTWRVIPVYLPIQNRFESDNYGYIINTASQKYLTYDPTTGLVSQKQKLPETSNQSQRWHLGNGFEFNVGLLPIKPFLDRSKFLVYTTDETGATTLTTSSTNKRWFIKPSKPVPINLTSIRNLCPNRHTRGDREFNGNGPRINITTTLSIQNNQSEIWVNIDYKAEETEKDWSTVVGNWDYKVYTAPSGKKIKDIIQDKTTLFEHMSGRSGIQLIANLVSTDGNVVSSIEKGYWSAIREIKVVGDTGGDDISTDGDCNDDTRIEEINFRQLYVIFE